MLPATAQEKEIICRYLQTSTSWARVSQDEWTAWEFAADLIYPRVVHEGSRPLPQYEPRGLDVAISPRGNRRSSSGGRWWALGVLFRILWLLRVCILLSIRTSLCFLRDYAFHPRSIGKSQLVRRAVSSRDGRLVLPCLSRLRRCVRLSTHLIQHG